MSFVWNSKLRGCLFALTILAVASAGQGCGGEDGSLGEDESLSSEDDDLAETIDEVRSGCKTMDARLTSFNDSRSASGSEDFDNMAAISEKYWGRYRGGRVTLRLNGRTKTLRILDYCADRHSSCIENVRGVDTIIDVHVDAAKARFGLSDRAARNLYQEATVKVCR